MFTFPFAVGLGVFVIAVNIARTESGPSGTKRLDSNGYGRVKGDLGDLTQSLKWDSLKSKTETPTYRNKGDDAVFDPRGTVRYNILPSGRISKGVITSLGDEESKLEQAKDNCCHADTYAPETTNKEDSN